MTDLKTSTAHPDSLRANALVVVASGHKKKGFVLHHEGNLSADQVKGLRSMLQALNFSSPPLGADPLVLVVPAAGLVRAEVIAVAGVDQLQPDSVRAGVGAAVRELHKRSQVAVLSPADDGTTITAAAQGALLGAYSFDSQRSQPRAMIDTITLVSASVRKQAVKAALTQVEIVAAAINQARDLVNTPPAIQAPEQFAESVRRAASNTTVRVDVWDARKLTRMGCGGIIGVGQGSSRPPCLVKLTYRPAKAAFHLSLVGKGVTFDSGGLSLKPANSMMTMKCDMGGAAAVAMATLAIAQLRLPIRVTAYLPLVENMPSGHAQRPGDVLTTYNGTTVEVLNTDAEGRLILADALALACEDKPDLLVDVATLTGAQMVALGSRVAAIMGNSDAAIDTMVKASKHAGEPMWPMPLPQELRAGLDSKIADIANMGERMGSMLTAGLFLREFVDPTIAWTHLDIAGPAFNEAKPFGATPAGGTGFSVASLIALAELHAGA